MSIFDTMTVHQFDSWTDADLVRAIEHVAGEAEPEKSRAEYVAELAKRAIERERLAEQTERVQADVAAKIRDLLAQEK